MQIKVSPQDRKLLSRNWSIRRNGKYSSYAVAWVDGKCVRMHRLIMGALPGQIVDHINGDGLDNRRENLRIVSRAQNNQNARCFTGASKFKGVAKHHYTHKWRAYISVGGRQVHLGFFTEELAAARAYNKAALEYFGDYAKLNGC